MVFNSNVKTVQPTWRTTRKNQQNIQTCQSVLTIASKSRRLISFAAVLLPRRNWWGVCFWRLYLPNEELSGLWQRADGEPVGKQSVRRKWSWIGHTMRRISQLNEAFFNVEPTRQNIKVVAQEQLEKRHGGRNGETWNDGDRYNYKQKGPKSGALAFSGWWLMIRMGHKLIKYMLWGMEGIFFWGGGGGVRNKWLTLWGTNTKIEHFLAYQNLIWQYPLCMMTFCWSILPPRLTPMHYLHASFTCLAGIIFNFYPLGIHLHFECEAWWWKWSAKRHHA